MGQTVSQPDCSLHVTLKEIQPFADYEIRKLEVIDVSGGGGGPRGVVGGVVEGVEGGEGVVL